MRALRRIVALALLVLATNARAEELVDPASEPKFEATLSVGQRPFVLLGSGVRRKTPTPDSKLYAIALYVDEQAARRAFPALAGKAGGRTREKLLSGDRAPQFVVWGDFGKLAVLRFVRDADSKELREAWEEGLGALFADSAPSELRDRAHAFVELFDRDVKKGDEVRVQTWPDGRIAVEIAGVHKEAARDARVCRGIWEVWLGNKPISTELRKALLDQVDVLGK